MRKTRLLSTALIGSLALGPMVGCENLPGNKKEQGAVIGGAGGAAAGAVVASHHRVLGALIGGALGAGGGYLIGAQMSKNDERHREEAIEASRRAEASPARPDDCRNATTADLNNDGFVTLDEVVAMRRYGMSDDEMIGRLRATGQVFELTGQQEDYLHRNGVDDRVIVAMRDMNQADYRRAPDRYDNPNIGNEPISRPRY